MFIILLWSLADKLRIISTLITQLLTYASIRDVIEESIDQYKSVSYELKQIQWAEQRREREETQIRHKKRLEQRLHPQHMYVCLCVFPVISLSVYLL